MRDFKKEIDRIIQEGIEKDLDVETIKSQILALATQARKREYIPIEDYERLLKESKRKIQEARRFLVKSFIAAE
ncbi:MAG: hypothetical protein WBW16_09230 [Bacteroidota bacterium]